MTQTYPPCKGCGNSDGPGIHYEDCQSWREWEKADPGTVKTITFVRRKE